ncbi:MAG: hypothetical protein ACRDFS_01145 [Chloroflexota bacterium]
MRWLIGAVVVGVAAVVLALLLTLVGAAAGVAIVLGPAVLVVGAILMLVLAFRENVTE